MVQKLRNDHTSPSLDENLYDRISDNINWWTRGHPRCEMWFLEF